VGDAADAITTRLADANVKSVRAEVEFVEVSEKWNVTEHGKEVKNCIIPKHIYMVNRQWRGVQSSADAAMTTDFKTENHGSL